ncbi:unnamed protein product, partial [Symbiodinium sp. CCMP2456]
MARAEVVQTVLSAAPRLHSALQQKFPGKELRVEICSADDIRMLLQHASRMSEKEMRRAKFRFLRDNGCLFNYRLEPTLGVFYREQDGVIYLMWNSCYTEAGQVSVGFQGEDCDESFFARLDRTVTGAHQSRLGLPLRSSVLLCADWCYIAWSRELMQVPVSECAFCIQASFASMPSSAARDAAIELVLCEVFGGGGDFWRLGVRVFATVSAGACYRRMLALVHPDKNNSSPRSTQATRRLLELWENFSGMSDLWWESMMANTRPGATNFVSFGIFGASADCKGLCADFLNAPAGVFGLCADFFNVPADWIFAPGCKKAPPTAKAASSAKASAPPPGPEPQDDYMGDEGDPEPGCEDGKMAGWLRYEPANASELDRALNSDAVRRFAEFNLFEILLSLRRRLVKVSNGVGLLPVWQRESRHPPGLPGRVFCGIGRLPRPDEVGGKRKADEEKREELQAARAALIAQLPKAIQRELLVLELPEALVGRSAFSYPRLVKYFCRHALNVVEVDLVNSFYQLLSKEIELPEVLKNYVTYREATLQVLLSGLNSHRADYENKAAKEARRRAAKADERRPWAEEDEPEILQPSKPLTRQDAKGLLIALAGLRHVGEQLVLQAPRLRSPERGARPPAGPSQRNREGRELRADEVPGGPQSGSAGVAQGPQSRLGVHGVLQVRRPGAPRPGGLQAGCRRRPGGFGARRGRRGAGECRAAAAADLGLEVAIKETPDPLQYAAEEHPEFNWSLQAKRSYREFAQVRDACLAHISMRRVRPNGSDFADFVASLLAPVVNVPHEDGEKRTTFEFFDGKGFWVPKHKDDMGALIRISLKNLSRPAYGGPFTPPEPLNDSCWTKSLVDEVLGLLSGHTMAALDSDRTRGKVLYSDGVVVDFATGERRQAQPGDRMSLHAEASSVAWVPPVDTHLFSKVETFLRTRKQTLEENEEGLAVVDAFEELKPHSALLRLLRKYGSWLQVLYILRLFARAIVALERLCELFYLHGPGSSGKDVLMLILLRFLGYEPQHYGLLVSGRYFVAGAKSGKESASPQLDQMRGKRFIWGSEVPEHEDLDTDFLKALCEQGGAPLTGRGLYRNPRSFRPMGVFCATSNFPPKVKQIDDDGWARRAREWQTEARFVARPSKITEHKADDSLKKKINDGYFHAEMNFFALGLFNSLSEELNPGTELLPKPPQMVLLEEQNRENVKTVDKFLAEYCERVSQLNHGSPWSAFVEALKGYLDCDRKVARTRLTSAGIKMHNAGVKNVPTDNQGT